MVEKKCDPDKGQSCICSLLSGVSLWEFLQSLGYSRSWIKKYGPPKSILERVITSSSEVHDLSLSLLNKKLVNPHYQGPPIKILKETDDFLAIEKPVNIHGHPQVYEDQKNCLSALRSMDRGSVLVPYHSLSSDAGLLFRLDFVTSGCLIYAKRPFIKERIFSDRSLYILSKEYRCRVAGRVPKEGGEISSYLTPSERKGRKMKVSSEKKNDGHLAKLSYEVLDFDEERETSELKVFLETGLRHQIRAQLSFIGHPIVGDTLYGGPQAKRVYLHAEKYCLKWDEREIQFFSEVPWDFSSPSGGTS